MSDALTWEEPPAPGSGYVPAYARQADELRARPGEWARLKGSPHRSIAYHIQVGRYSAFRPVGAWEAQVRKVAGRPQVWVRFIGKAPR